MYVIKSPTPAICFERGSVLKIKEKEGDLLSFSISCTYNHPCKYDTKIHIYKVKNFGRDVTGEITFLKSRSFYCFFNRKSGKEITKDFGVHL